MWVKVRFEPASARPQDPTNELRVRKGLEDCESMYLECRQRCKCDPRWVDLAMRLLIGTSGQDVEKKRVSEGKFGEEAPS